MCVIIDTSMAADFVNEKKNTAPLKKWLDRGGGKLISPPSGTPLDAEYRGSRFERILTEYREAGTAVTISESDTKRVQKLSAKLKPRLKSNDSHIIALAKVSGAKLLASYDEDLGDDFKKHISKGKVYKYATHESLLKQNTCPL